MVVVSLIVYLDINTSNDHLLIVLLFYFMIFIGVADRNPLASSVSDFKVSLVVWKFRSKIDSFLSIFKIVNYNELSVNN